MVNLLLHSLHLLMYYIIRCCQSISWRVSGVHRHLMATRNGENYSTSAQLLKVWSRSRDGLISIIDLHMFITSHVGFVHPEFAMKKHISLVTVRKEHAIFCVPREGVNIYNSRKFPFSSDAMLETAEYLLVIPITSFTRLAESIPDTDAKVLWIYHAGRCGSTALVQAFNALPDALAISEPISHYSLLHSYCDRKLSFEHDRKLHQEYRQLFRCTVRMSLKPTLKPADVIVVKTIATNAFANRELLTEMFPNYKMLFMYREAEQQVSSLYRALCDLITPKYPSLTDFIVKKAEVTALKEVCCYMTKEHVQWIFGKEKIKQIDLFTIFAISWAENCHHYRDIVERQKLDIPAIKYEHMISNMKGHLTILFEYMGLCLTDERYRMMQEALSCDSQESSHVSREIVSKRKVQITPDMIAEANECLEYYGLPKWGETLVLPHTVSV